MKKGSKASPETREKLRISHLGHIHTEEHKRKIGLAGKGKVLPEETRRKISESRIKKGIKLTEEHKEKLREYAKSHPLPKEHYEKLSIMFKGRASPMKGRHHSEEAKQKLHISLVGRKIHSIETKLKLSEDRRGEKGSNWKGGISFEPYCLKFNDEFKERVREFYGRVCIECGTPENGHKHCVHHVNYDKMTCCNTTQPLFMCLCNSCNTKANNNRKYWEPHYTEMINQYYQGKCYLTKDEYKEWVLS